MNQQPNSNNQIITNRQSPMTKDPFDLADTTSASEPVGRSSQYKGELRRGAPLRAPGYGGHGGPPLAKTQENKK